MLMESNGTVAMSVEIMQVDSSLMMDVVIAWLNRSLGAYVDPRQVMGARKGGLRTP